MNREPRYPEKSTDVFRISTSSLETYLGCGLRYFLERTLGYRRTTVPMAIGTAVAAAAKIDNATKIFSSTHSGRTLADMVGHSVERYDNEIETSELTGTKREIDIGRDDAAAATRCYGEKLSPNITDVIWAERRIVAEVTDGIELAGTPDCATKKAIRDTKTGQPWTPKRVGRSRQLTAYDLLFEATTGKSPERVAIDSLSKSGGRWHSQTLWSSRTEEDRTSFIEVLQRAKKGIEAGIELPAAESSWKCAPDWCQFYKNGCPIHK